MITRIEAHNYRCFPRLVVDLDRYHVLAGPNGAGKTTLLDMPGLIGDMLRHQRIVSAFLERPGSRLAPRATTLTDLLHKGTGYTIGFAFEARLPEDVVETLVSAGAAITGQHIPTHLRYEVQFEVTARALNVSSECLFLFSEKGSRPRTDVNADDYVFPQGKDPNGPGLRKPDWQPVLIREGRSATRLFPEVDTRTPFLSAPRRSRRRQTLEEVASPGTRPLQIVPEQLALGAVPPDQTLFPAAVWISGLLKNKAIFFDPDWEALRRPAPPGDPLTVLSSGRNLPWLALHLRETDPVEFEAWEDHVRTALPQLKGILPLEREEDHYAYFSIDYHGGFRVTSSGLSDGTLRILAMTILPFLPREIRPQLLAAEEPENGIHPRAIETAVESLGSLYGSQVLISTHSPLVLAHTALRDILATRLDADGTVTVVRGDQHPRLADWQGELDLGTMFAAGVLN